MSNASLISFINNSLYSEEIGTHIYPVCGSPTKMYKRELKYNKFCSVKYAQQHNWSDLGKKRKQSKNLKLFWSDELKCSATRSYLQKLWDNKTEEERKLFYDKSSRSHKLMFKK